MTEAMFYEKLKENKVKCTLCPHKCTITDGKTGICGVRKNINGTLFALTHSLAVAQNTDPIEKKPLFHFLPGTRSFSIASAGCNLKCLHCQNYSISQLPCATGNIAGEKLPPVEVVKMAEYMECKSISYTYTEPTIFFEYAYDTSVIAAEKGLKNIFVTNGYTSAETVKQIAPYLHAANIDLKSFTNEFYWKICGGKLKPVLDTIELMYSFGVWIEITTLIIPDLNDSKHELLEIAKYIYGIDKYIPWHLSGFYPTYKLTNIAPTPFETIEKGIETGLNAGLKYVYSGNFPGSDFESTFCHHCSEVIIKRKGYHISSFNIEGNRCRFCRTEIPGVF